MVSSKRIDGLIITYPDQWASNNQIEQFDLKTMNSLTFFNCAKTPNCGCNTFKCPVCSFSLSFRISFSMALFLAYGFSSIHCLFEARGLIKIIQNNEVVLNFAFLISKSSACNNKQWCVKVEWCWTCKFASFWSRYYRSGIWKKKE